MELIWSNTEMMRIETDKCYSEIEGIREFLDAQKQIYGFDGGLCFGDYQVDAVAYRQENSSISLRIVGNCPNFDFNGSTKTKAFFIFDFFNVEDVNIDVAPEYWLSDIFIQKTSDGKYLFWCDGTNINFVYEYAKVNRWWGE